MRARSVLLLASMLLFSGSAVAETSAAQTVTVSMRSRFYAPNPIRLSANQPVTLKLVNADSSTHGFGARRFFRTAKILSGNAGSGNIQLAPGETATFTLIPVKGSYKVECSHHQMDKLGMQGQIIVE